MRKIICALILTVIISLVYLPKKGYTQETRTKIMTLDECIKVAIEKNPDIINGNLSIEESEYAVKSARGNFWPKLSLQGNIILWNNETTFSLSGGSTQIDTKMLPAPDSVYEMIIKEMITAKPTVVREKVTSELTITLAQPLSLLYTINKAYHLSELGVDMAKIKLNTIKNNVIFKVTEAYYQALQVKRLYEIAQTAVNQIEAHVKQATSFYNSGVIGKNELLVAEVQLANAKEALIKAQAGVTLAQSNLSIQIGLSANDEVVPQDTYPSEFPEFQLSLEECINKAYSKRTEIKEIETAIKMAQTGKDLAKAQMIPSISVAGNYQHNEGSSFADENVYFIGGFIQWNIWEWGTKYYKIKEAEMKVLQAKEGLRKLKDYIQLEVKKNYLDLQSAKESFKVAEFAVKQAEENYRIETERFKANVNTSTDVLDAESLLTRASSSLASAYYNYLIALQALKKSINEL